MAYPNRRHNSMYRSPNNPRGRRRPSSAQQFFTPGWGYSQPHRDSNARMEPDPFTASIGFFGPQARVTRGSTRMGTRSGSEPTATPHAQPPAADDVEGTETDDPQPASDPYADVPAYIRQHARFPELVQAREHIRAYGPMHRRSRPYQGVVQDILADMERDTRDSASRGGDAQRCPVHAENAPFPDNARLCTCGDRPDARRATHGGRGHAGGGEEWYGGYGGLNRSRGLDTSCVMM